MACKPVCRLCDKIRISTAVNVVTGNIVINLPAGSYNNNEKYCVIVAQNIPSTAPIGANVLISIGGGTVSSTISWTRSRWSTAGPMTT